MKISLNWIKDYVVFPDGLTPEQMAVDLTMCTVEVEGVYSVAKQFNRMVIGQIKSISTHPNADKLKLVTVDIGRDTPVDIVCGGYNLATDHFVIVALPGAQVRWHGEGETMKLKPVKIRGEKSNGMICSSDEIGLEKLFPSKVEGEIVDLSDLMNQLALIPGKTLTEALGLDDIIFDIDNKSLTNRPDLWGHYGIAREFAAIYNLELKPLSDSVTLPEANDQQISITIQDRDRCYRYIGVCIDGCRHMISPFWIRQRLFLMDQQSISFIVDLTNYVMFSVGQPLHVFDYNQLEGRQIIIRKAAFGESIFLLDGNKYELNDSNLVIADAHRPVALAGIMGGEFSSVNEKSRKILLEAATFEPTGIRRTAGKLGLRTESSIRFEKGIDTFRASLGVDLFLTILKKVQPDIQLVASADAFLVKPETISVQVSRDFINSRIGYDLSSDQITEKLNRLHFNHVCIDDTFKLDVPTWRATGDVSIPEDIVEEVARLYGYDNIKFIAPQINLNRAVLQPEFDFIRHIKEYLAFTAGMNEIMAYPWVEDTFLEASGFSAENCVQLLTPPSVSTSCLQPSLIPNMLFAVKQNYRQFEQFAVFQLSPVFNKQNKLETSGVGETLPDHIQFAAGVLVGNDEQEMFFKAKGIIIGLFQTLPFRMPVFNRELASSAWVKQGSQLQILTANEQTVLGRIGLLSQKVAMKAEIKHRAISIFELNVSELLRMEKVDCQYQPIPRFPSTEYDLSVLVSKAISWESIECTVAASESIITDITFLNEYSGKQVPDGKKTVAFRLKLSDPTSTLSSDKIESAIDHILKNLKNEVNATLRPA